MIANALVLVAIAAVIAAALAPIARLDPVTRARLALVSLAASAFSLFARLLA